MNEDEHPFEYHETQMEERSGDPAMAALAEPLPPPASAGIGWVLHEKFRSGALLVFRWRRRKVPRGQSKA